MHAIPDLYMFGRASLNAESYIRDILDMDVVLCAPKFKRILIQGKAHLHVINCVQENLEATEIRFLRWLARNQDFRRIGHGRARLENAIKRGPNLPETLRFLKSMQVKSLENMAQNMIQNVLAIQAVL